MIRIEFVIAKDSETTDVAWESISDMNLHYDCFLGSVIFQLAGTDFSVRRGWVPVLDFGIGLLALVDALAPGEVRVFEFTESERLIRVHRVDDLVEVTTNYASGTAVVDFAELHAAVRESLRRLVARLTDEHAGLRRNTAFQRMAQQAS